MLPYASTFVVPKWRPGILWGCHDSLWAYWERGGSDLRFGLDILVRFVFLCYLMPLRLFYQSGILGSYGGYHDPFGALLGRGLTKGPAHQFWLV